MARLPRAGPEGALKGEGSAADGDICAGEIYAFLWASGGGEGEGEMA